MAVGTGCATTRFYTWRFFISFKSRSIKRSVIRGVLSLVLMLLLIGAHEQGVRLNYMFSDCVSFVLLSSPSTRQEVS